MMISLQNELDTHWLPLVFLVNTSGRVQLISQSFIHPNSNKLICIDNLLRSIVESAFF